MSFSIRKGEYKDLSSALALVRELAVYEREPEAVTASLQDYQEAYQEGIFEILVAETENQVIGLMLFYMTFSTWRGKMLYLEDFIVTEHWRGKGVGSALYHRFMEICKEKRAVLAKWQVLNWNDPAIDFYEKRGVIVENDWLNCKKFMNSSL
ncbi:MAG: GNAT family N-acetyltransferase [Saprospiraceae bacterium]|nr:GNAT family N-acetyltransferase [Saprospiraceae bacterium]